VSYVLSYALYFAALALMAFATPARGLRLFAALLTLIVGVGVVNVMIEAVAFDVLGAGEVLLGSAFNIAVFAALAGVALLASGKALGHGTPSAVPLRLTPGRCLAAVAAYIALYFVAGMTVYPFVREFYAGRELPALPAILGLQAVRGAIYLAASVPLLRLGPRWAPLVLGTAFVLIAGLAPLAAENALMPAEVRFYHAIEIGVSNFLFGLLLAWLVMPARPPGRVATPAG
jgi:hypothetical protein